MEFKKVSELISNNAVLFPDKTCIFFKDKQYTYKQIENIVRHVANTLRSNGVKKGDRVGILLENSPEFAFAYFGIMMLGAVAVPTNVFLKDREIAANMNDCAATYLITSETFADRMTHMLQMAMDMKMFFSFEKCSFESVVFNSLQQNTAEVDEEIDINDLALVLYTSGTTGRPKGVMLTHFNLLSNAKSFSRSVEDRHNDRMLLLLPMFHATSMMCCMLTPLVKGTSVIIVESILEVSKAYYPEMLKKLKPTLIVGVPALFATLAKARDVDKENFPFRLCICGGAPLPVEIIDQFKQTYGVMILEGYGLSEASPVVAFNPLTMQKAGSIGVALPSIEIKLVDEEGNDVGLHKEGELCVNGPNVMKGYWGQPEETARTIKNGWLHTGDVAKQDEDGFLFIVDRIKDLILVKGMNVYPREIEELLYKYNGISSAAVVGLPDGQGSEIPIAYIKTDPGADIDQSKLKEYLRYNLASYKIPRRIVFIDEMPVNAGGKILKKELRERAKKEFK